MENAIEEASYGLRNFIELLVHIFKRMKNFPDYQPFC